MESNGLSWQSKRLIKEVIIISLIGFFLNLVIYLAEKYIPITKYQRDLVDPALLLIAFGYLHIKFNETMSFLYSDNRFSPFKPIPRTIKYIGYFTLAIGILFSISFVFSII